MSRRAVFLPERFASGPTSISASRRTSGPFRSSRSVADNWATFFLTLISAALAAAGLANDFTLIVLGVVVIIVEVNIARLILTLPPLQIAMFLIAQLVGVSIGRVVIGFLFPVPPDVTQAATAALAQSTSASL